MRRLGYEIQATLVRMFAYVGALAVLAVAAAYYVEMSEVGAAVAPAPRPEWTSIERPYRAFAVTGPGFADTGYAIHRHGAGGRKDIITGMADDTGQPRLLLEIYRPGQEIEAFGSPELEATIRASDLRRASPFAAAEAINGKFGPVGIFEFTAQTDHGERSCLAFVRSVAEPRLQISGWYCRNGRQVVERRTLACAIEGLSLFAAASDPGLQQFFADAEQRRTFCTSRAAPRGATVRLNDWIESPQPPSLRRSVAAR